MTKYIALGIGLYTGVPVTVLAIVFFLQIILEKKG
jgi:hypothetical protein